MGKDMEKAKNIYVIKYVLKVNISTISNGLGNHLMKMEI